VAPQILALLGDGRFEAEKRFRNCSTTDALGSLVPATVSAIFVAPLLEILSLTDPLVCILLASAALLFVALLTR